MRHKQRDRQGTPLLFRIQLLSVTFSRIFQETFYNNWGSWENVVGFPMGTGTSTEIEFRKIWMPKKSTGSTHFAIKKFQSTRLSRTAFIFWVLSRPWICNFKMEVVWRRSGYPDERMRISQHCDTAHHWGTLRQLGRTLVMYGCASQLIC